MLTGRMVGLDVKGSSGGEELVICPFHDDHKPSAWYNPIKGLFWCSVCQRGASAEQLMKMFGDGTDLEIERDEELPDFDLMPDAAPIVPLTSLHTPYIAGRGVSESTMKMYDVRWQDEPAEAAVFLMRGLTSNVKGVVHRYVEPAKTGTRYRKMGEMSPVWPAEWLIALRERAKIVVVEGPWSAMVLNQAMMGDEATDVRVFSSFGAKANQAMIDLLTPFSPVFLFDNDEAGKRAKDKMKSRHPSAMAKIVSPSPDDMSGDQLAQLARIIRRLEWPS